MQQTLAVPMAGRALGRALPLEAAVAPILAAQRSVLKGLDPTDFPRAPVEIVLVTLTLLAQLGVELSGGGGGGSLAAGREAEEGRGQRRRRAGVTGRRQRRGQRRDSARAARLRRFLGEQAAAGEAKLCLGHAACRTESKDLARRAAALISLLQVHAVLARLAAGKLGIKKTSRVRDVVVAGTAPSACRNGIHLV